MPNIDKHSPGAFCWLELGTPDQNASKSFYTSLFGWTVFDSPLGPGQVYTMFQIEGRSAAAAYALDPKIYASGVPAHWMLYIAVEDASATADRAAALGGKVLSPAFDVAGAGRMAVLEDPTGAVFSIWQAKQHAGIEIGGVEGTLCWVDLSTPDPEPAARFYRELLGWQTSPGENDPSGYLHIKNGDEVIGGIQPAWHRNPNAPPHWLPYILVANCDQKAEQAKQLGARLLVSPMSLENVGRFAVVADPQGAVFALFQSPSQA